MALGTVVYLVVEATGFLAVVVALGTVIYLVVEATGF